MIMETFTIIVSVLLIVVLLLAIFCDAIRIYQYIKLNEERKKLYFVSVANWKRAVANIISRMTEKNASADKIADELYEAMKYMKYKKDE